jgi:NIPSNAP
LTQGYFERALIPALNRLEMAPVGAFNLDVGPETPTYYVLVPATSAEALVALDTRPGKDTEYVKASSGFRDAPASAPAFVRAERSLLSAFASWPKLVVPKKEKRKVQMFNEAEIEIFTRTGLTPVFFGDTVIGTRMPSLTYMLTFADTAELTAKWAAFSVDPAWKELSHRPGKTDAEIVSNISNLYLSPLSCSQI